MITQEYLMQILDYNSITGIFIYKQLNKYCRNKKIGDIAGSKNGKGYYQISINNKRYYLHRLAWLYIYGELQKELDIDHIDGNPLNNSINNLRLVTTRENCNNFKKHRINLPAGVCWDKIRNKYKAYIWINGKTIHLGRYTTKEEARNAYLVAQTKFHCVPKIKLKSGR